MTQDLKHLGIEFNKNTFWKICWRKKMMLKMVVFFKVYLKYTGNKEQKTKH